MDRSFRVGLVPNRRSGPQASDAALRPACKASRQQAGLGVGLDPTTSPGSGPSPGTIVRGVGEPAALALAPAGMPFSAGAFISSLFRFSLLVAAARADVS
jgi:hypothetical protein